MTDSNENDSGFIPWPGDDAYSSTSYNFDPDANEEFLANVRQLIDDTEDYHTAAFMVSMILSVIDDHPQEENYYAFINRELDRKFADDVAASLGWPEKDTPENEEGDE